MFAIGHVIVCPWVALYVLSSVKTLISNTWCINVSRECN